ncbi:hypothetical protein FQA39_LY00176 [Lamprigera yunnana]|nr:hypothetical protein FQA39_LY00176 [Lamprigera yunnana]
MQNYNCCKFLEQGTCNYPTDNSYNNEQQVVCAEHNNSTGAAEANNFDLKSVEEVPEKYRSVFAQYSNFNPIQSKVFDTAFWTDQSIVVSAPTGSGKTTIFELAIVHFLYTLDNLNDQVPYGIVYVAPLKALCEERLTDWVPKFSHLGLNCISVTGDTDNFDVKSLTNHHLIITTPEKWDTLTRKWRVHKSFVSSIKLFMIDEVHLLHDDNRGATVEVIVSRMKTIQYSLEKSYNSMNIRFIAVSATIPNAEDIAKWLELPNVPAISFKFGHDMRPIKLKKVVYGYNYDAKRSNPFKFDMMLNYKLQSIIIQHAEGKPTLIFCATRKNVEMTTKHLADHLPINLNSPQRQLLNEVAVNISDPKLKAALQCGIGFHHAGLLSEDRKIIEDVFRRACLPVLVTTRTLAMGINLPAHLVIIKSTKYYQDGQYQDYSESMLLQMIGRAGRPQFDTSATAVILTTKWDKEKYENMVEGVRPVESYLHKHLTEHLNAEIVLQTITDLGAALEWLTSTFLYIRARINPKHYGLPCGLPFEKIDKKLLEMCQIQINKLIKAGMLEIDENIIITATPMGELMAKYYIALNTMNLFVKVSGHETLSEILSLISKCEEFSEMYLRANDKKTLNLLNKSVGKETIRFPFNQKISTVSMKINCIIQAVFGNLKISDSSLVNESEKIMRIGERISNCLCEYLCTIKYNFTALLNAVILVKCFHSRMWENSPYVSKQLIGIGNVYSSALAKAKKTTFESLLSTNPRDIERIINRRPPMGNTIIEEVEHLPNYKLELTYFNNCHVNVEIKLINAQSMKSRSSVKKVGAVTVLVGDVNNFILWYKLFRHSDFIEQPVMQKSILLSDKYEGYIYAYFISADWVGIDRQSSILISNDKSQEKCMPTIVSTGDNSGKKRNQVQMSVEHYFKKTKKTDNKNTKNEEQDNQIGKRQYDDVGSLNITTNNNCIFLPSKLKYEGKENEYPKNPTAVQNIMTESMKEYKNITRARQMLSEYSAEVNMQYQNENNATSHKKHRRKNNTDTTLNFEASLSSNHVIEDLEQFQFQPHSHIIHNQDAPNGSTNDLMVNIPVTSDGVPQLESSGANDIYQNLSDFTWEAFRPTLKDTLSKTICSYYPLSDKEYNEYEKQGRNKSAEAKDSNINLKNSVASTHPSTSSYTRICEAPRPVSDYYITLISVNKGEKPLERELKETQKQKVDMHTQTTSSLLRAATKDASTSSMETEQETSFDITLLPQNISEENGLFLQNNFITSQPMFSVTHLENDDINISQDTSFILPNVYNSETESNTSSAEDFSPQNFRQTNARNIQLLTRNNPLLMNPFAESDSYLRSMGREDISYLFNDNTSAMHELINNDSSIEAMNSYPSFDYLLNQNAYNNHIFDSNTNLYLINAVDQQSLMSAHVTPDETFENYPDPLYDDSIYNIFSSCLEVTDEDLEI